MKNIAETSFLSNPYVLTGGAILLVILLFFWNKHNTSTLRKRRNRSFRDNYLKRKQERKKTE